MVWKMMFLSSLGMFGVHPLVFLENFSANFIPGRGISPQNGGEKEWIFSCKMSKYTPVN